MMEKCPKFIKCDAPLCPLDKDIQERVYSEGEPTCKMKPQDLASIMGNEFRNEYNKFIKICLRRGARFSPLKQSQK